MTDNIDTVNSAANHLVKKVNELKLPFESANTEQMESQLKGIEEAVSSLAAAIQALQPSIYETRGFTEL